jgi:Outer membrane protein beta-barrel domain
MNKNVHDTDDFFRSVYQQFEETPSPLVWDKINSELDKKELISNTGKFRVWKRVAILLLFLPAGFVLLDSDILNLGSSRSNDSALIKKSIQSEQEKTPNHKKEDRTGAVVQNRISQNQNVSTPIQIERNLSPAHSNYRIESNGKKMTLTKNYNPETYKLALIIPSLDSEKSSGNIRNEYAIADKRDPIAPFSRNNSSSPLYKNTGTKKGSRNSYIPDWSISAFVSYDRVNYKLESEVPNYITSIKHRESHEPSFSGGVLVARQLTKQWSVQTGLVYSTIAIGIDPQKIYAFQDPVGDFAYKYVTSSGYAFIKPGFGQSPAFGDSLIAAEAEHTLNSIGIPLMAKFRIGKNRLTLLPGAGIEANFITSAKVEVELTDEFNREIVSIQQLNGSKSFYLSGVAEAELRYELNKKLSVNLNPAFRFAISPITEDNVVETFPYSLGIRVGVTRKF